MVSMVEERYVIEADLGKNKFHRPLEQLSQLNGGFDYICLCFLDI